jgi:hypothetical protein
MVRDAQVNFLIDAADVPEFTRISMSQSKPVFWQEVLVLKQK